MCRTEGALLPGELTGLTEELLSGCTGHPELFALGVECPLPPQTRVTVTLTAHEDVQGGPQRRPRPVLSRAPSALRGLAPQASCSRRTGQAAGRSPASASVLVPTVRVEAGGGSVSSDGRTQWSRRLSGTARGTDSARRTGWPGSSTPSSTRGPCRTQRARGTPQVPASGPASGLSRGPLGVHARRRSTSQWPLERMPQAVSPGFTSLQLVGPCHRIPVALGGDGHHPTSSGETSAQT